MATPQRIGIAGRCCGCVVLPAGRRFGMMTPLEFPGWRLEFDRDSTAAAHARAQPAGPNACTCEPCRNWAATRVQFLPAAFLDLLSQLGIPLDREAEIYHNGRLQSGRHSYGAWYHFVGRVLYGDREGSPNVVYGPLSVYFHSAPALMSQAFIGQPVVQLEVVAEIPWLSDIPESE
jgi:hypothetical protein